MQEIRAAIHIAAPREPVFRALSEHTTFLRSAAVSASILRPGDTDRDGLGCVREVRGRMGVRCVEVITGWDPPWSYEYMMRDVALPLRHGGGRVELSMWGDGTDVVWTSRFEITLPLVGRMVERRAAPAVARAFMDLLCASKVRLEASGD